MKTVTAYIGFGSNLGSKVTNCRKAIKETDGIPGCSVKIKSHFYRTEPVGVEGHDWYVNGVISLLTDISAQDLMKNILAIEADMGRKRKGKWDSRPIDLDILLFGEHVINKNDLTIPHPLMHLRKFALVPMVQLVPDLIHPVLGKTMTELLDVCPEKGQAVFQMAVR